MKNIKLSILEKLNLISFPLLKMGLSFGFCNKEDIVDYAINALSENKIKNDEALLALCGLSGKEEDAINCYLEKVISDNHLYDESVSDKWKIASLIEVEESTINAEEKIDLLQLIYADFNYPEDLSTLSKYTNDGTDPLEAMRNIISSKIRHLSKEQSSQFN